MSDVIRFQVIFLQHRLLYSFTQAKTIYGAGCTWRLPERVNEYENSQWGPGTNRDCEGVGLH